MFNDKYKHVRLKLVGADGNAFNIIGLGVRALKCNEGAGDVETFIAEAVSGDYDHVIQTCQETFDVC